MPYAQQHYPFENKEKFEASFPADFIAEGIDQTRGWFYTLMVLSTALFDKPAFKNLICNGLVLAEDGQKMSKRKKNYPPPEEILDEYGAAAPRPRGRLAGRLGGAISIWPPRAPQTASEGAGLLCALEPKRPTKRPRGHGHLRRSREALACGPEAAQVATLAAPDLRLTIS